MEQQIDRGFAEAISQVARALQAEKSGQETLQKMVELAQSGSSDLSVVG